MIRPYEIISIGPEAGIVEMVKNATTIDSLKRTLHQDFKEISGVYDFFVQFY